MNRGLIIYLYSIIVDGTKITESVGITDNSIKEFVFLDCKLGVRHIAFKDIDRQLGFWCAGIKNDIIGLNRNYANTTLKGIDNDCILTLAVDNGVFQLELCESVFTFDDGEQVFIISKVDLNRRLILDCSCWKGVSFPFYVPNLNKIVEGLQPFFDIRRKLLGLPYIEKVNSVSIIGEGKIVLKVHGVSNRQEIFEQELKKVFKYIVSCKYKEDNSLEIYFTDGFRDYYLENYYMKVGFSDYMEQLQNQMKVRV